MTEYVYYVPGLDMITIWYYDGVLKTIIGKEMFDVILLGEL